MDDIELNDLIIYEDLGLSAHAVAKLENIRDELRAINIKTRTTLFLCGRLFCRARDTILADSGTDGTVQMFIDSLGMKSQNFWSTVKLFEVWEPYEPWLVNVSVKVQRHFCTHKLDEGLLREVVAIAKHREVTHAEFQEKMLRPEIQRAAEVTAEQDEDWDEEDQEEEVNEEQADNDQQATSKPAERLPSLSNKSLEDARKRFIGKATKALRELLADINSFCKTNRLKKGEWYDNIEEKAECLLQALDSWTRVTRL